jgi:hypothetical protein
MATKTANVCATIHEGKFDINFDCVGVLDCKFARCEFMPVDGEYPCFYSDHSTCISPHAKLAAIELLRNRLSKEKKDIEEGFEG